jgi:hypothetical protein
MGRELATGSWACMSIIDAGLWRKRRETIRRFLGKAFERGLIPHRQELEFVE